MKKYLYIYVILTSIVGFSGCQTGDIKTIVTKADRDVSIELNEISLERELAMPSRMFMVDNKLVILQHQGDTLFSVFPEPLNGCFINCGLKGRGPDEFMGIDARSIVAHDGGFQCVDVGGVLKKVSISNNRISVTSKEKIKTDNIPQNGILIHDGYVTINLNDKESEYLYYGFGKNEQESMKLVGEYPDWTADAGMPAAFLYMKHLIGHPTANKFASFYSYFRRVRITDLDKGNMIDIDVQIPDKFPEYSPNEKIIAYSSFPCVTRDGIFALCLNKITSDDKKMPEIHLWGWDGTLKRRITLNKPIDMFVVDSNRHIYALDRQKPEYLYHSDLHL